MCVGFEGRGVKRKASCQIKKRGVGREETKAKAIAVCCDTRPYHPAHLLALAHDQAGAVHGRQAIHHIPLHEQQLRERVGAAQEGGAGRLRGKEQGTTSNSIAHTWSRVQCRAGIAPGKVGANKLPFLPPIPSPPSLTAPSAQLRSSPPTSSLLHTPSLHLPPNIPSTLPPHLQHVVPSDQQALELMHARSHLPQLCDTLGDL